MVERRQVFHSWHTVLECTGSTTKPEPTAEPDPPLRGSCRLQILALNYRRFRFVVQTAWAVVGGELGRRP